MIDISKLPENVRELYKECSCMFSLFPRCDGKCGLIIVDFVGQEKIITLEIIKIYIVQTEFRVAHLMLSSLCRRFPDDPYLWNYLGKLYLDIGKREDAVSAFKTAKEAFSKLPNIPKEVAEANEFFNQYFTYYQ